MNEHHKKPLAKCKKCGILTSPKSKYCKPCQDEVRTEYERNYQKIKRYK
jgi:uncharacterized OB-fold protein